MCDDSIQVGVGWPIYLQIPQADLVDCLIVHKKGHIGQFQTNVMIGYGTVVEFLMTGINIMTVMAFRKLLLFIAIIKPPIRGGQNVSKSLE